MRPSAAARAAVGVLCALVAGCGMNSATMNVPRISKRALQEDIAERLAGAGEKPEEVVCNQDLIGKVGATARCEVVVSVTNSFEPIITVTAVDGAAIDYEMSPAVSRRQLEDVVVRLLADAGTADVNTVSCESGVEGHPGALAHCNVNAAGVWSRRTIQVAGVSGLSIRLEVVPLPRRLRPARPSS